MRTQIIAALVLAILGLSGSLALLQAQTMSSFPAVEGEVYQMFKTDEAAIFGEVDPLTGIVDQRGVYSQIGVLDSFVTTITGNTYLHPGATAANQRQLYRIDISSGELTSQNANLQFISFEAGEDGIYGMTTDKVLMKLNSQTLFAEIIASPGLHTIDLGVTAIDNAGRRFFTVGEKTITSTFPVRTLAIINLDTGAVTHTDIISIAPSNMVYRDDGKLVGVANEFVGPGGTMSILRFVVIDPETGDVEMRVDLPDLNTMPQAAGGLDAVGNYLFPGRDFSGNLRLFAVDTDGNFHVGPVQETRSGQQLGTIQGFEIKKNRFIYLPIIRR
jgi:hypothetical protein